MYILLSFAITFITGLIVQNWTDDKNVIYWTGAIAGCIAAYVGGKT